MNSPSDLMRRDALLATARQLAASGGLPAVLCGLQAEHGMDESTAAELAATAFGIQAVRLGDLPEQALALSLASFADYVRRQVLLLEVDEGCLAVTANPFDAGLRDWLEGLLPLACRVDWRLAPNSVVTAYLAREEARVRTLDAGFSSASVVAISEGGGEKLSLQSIAEEGSTIVRLLRSTLHDGLKSGASDIHIEAGQRGLSIKYRIDGVLNFASAIDGSDTAEQLISRIKVLSELDIAERRVPQDGRFKVNWQEREIDIRVSIMPCIWGEDAVLRVLDKQALSDRLEGLRLDVMGFDGDTMHRIRRLSAEPYGMLLVTGPTGSGKTTTLYAALSEINRGEDKIITIEDPVEYQLPGVLQIPVNEKKGLSFARGLRSILRHDPDKIMVGEIRDPETAQIAVQAALTGHLVFTTVHANNVFDVIGRFLHMQVDPYNLVSALNGVVAQRLIRVLCPACAVPSAPEAGQLADAEIDIRPGEDWLFRRAVGCGTCRGTGYRGRRAIAELLALDDEIRELILARAPIRQLKEAARRGGTHSLRESALDLVKAGVTSLEEANRVTFVA
ncbi:general secretion pathway protein GspE [Dechloromonas denitrificans]|uniref:General secretion pathway protein GspE n=1 Tax=Dechloromonas denitrificans TaxID=281362 RepID=A0A133XLG0_9RHOO|nr:GspE/PulE family protein [Dechloromonas denitrificans]KXB31757.1 general secretion pathway protein GspE [Dechloromonas denitrificans]